MKRKNITVEITYGKNEFPCTLTALYRWVTERITELDKLGCTKSSIYIDTIAGEDYDDPVLIVTYERPETDEELKARIAENKLERARRIEQKKIKEDSERKLYETLKAKYENGKHEWMKTGEGFLYDTFQCVHCGLEISETQLDEPLPKCVRKTE